MSEQADLGAFRRFEDAFEVVDEEAEREASLRPTVAMEVRAKVDVNHPDAKYAGLTLEAEERVRAREWEVERTRVRVDRRQDSDREARSRAYVAVRTPCELWEARPRDAREEISRGELAVVNRQATRLAGRTRGWTSAAVSKMIAERVRAGASVASAVLGVSRTLERGPGQVVPIGALVDVDDETVSVDGRVSELWAASHPAIAQVGLLEDETGVCKVTVWEKSDQPDIRVGERVRIRSGFVSVYNDQPGIAATRATTITFPDRGRWWQR